MADETIAAPPPVDPWSRTPEQATAALDVMQRTLHPPPPINPTTPAEARARLNELTDNREWGKRWVEGGVAEQKEYARLSELADQADEVKDAIDGTTPESNLIQTLGPNELSTRDLASAVEMFRDAGLNDDVINQSLRGSEVSEVSRSEFLAAKALKSEAAA